MAINESKANIANLVSWEKWRRSGALGTMLDAVTLPIRKEAKKIVGVGTRFSPDGTVKQSTLSIGEKVVFKGEHYTVTEPELYVVVPGEPFKFGQKVRARDLPTGTQTIAEARQREH